MTSHLLPCSDAFSFAPSQRGKLLERMASLPHVIALPQALFLSHTRPAPAFHPQGLPISVSVSWPPSHGVLLLERLSSQADSRLSPLFWPLALTVLEGSSSPSSPSVSLSQPVASASTFNTSLHLPSRWRGSCLCSLQVKGQRLWTRTVPRPVQFPVYALRLRVPEEQVPVSLTEKTVCKSLCHRFCSLYNSCPYSRSILSLFFFLALILGLNLLSFLF